MIDTALVTLLRQIAGVDTRVTPSTENVLITQNLPRVVYTLIDCPPQYTDSGVMAVRMATYQLDIFAAKMTDARAVASAITARSDATAPGLDGYRGTVDTTVIQRIWFGGQHIEPGIKIEGKDQSVARCVLELMVVYRETQ